MKKTTILLFVLLLSLSSFSQQRSRSFFGWRLEKDAKELIPANEVKLNMGTAIFGLYPEISYERIQNYDISYGVAAGIGLGDDSDYPLKFGITPFFRWFFGGNRETMNRAGAGFFIEANGALFSQEFYNDNSIGAGLGLALGWKYLTQSNWVGEIMLGAGRDFVNDGAYPRLGISIGKRF